MLFARVSSPFLQQTLAAWVDFSLCFHSCEVALLRLDDRTVMAFPKLDPAVGEAAYALVAVLAGA